ncbi:Tetratricopeptide repeat-containing protein [Alkalispirochaeta americana]|uniref:Tetratricopeptide repeat-containing protein n=1 Tax=Alkalispirochaeta americana TaxID=159291 RepID=A0A1N6PKJ0_9SPIO|nr:tetratricopeptide repeat protein [Alkalispirochaeta americana]SIQ04851.1 Tetratricopeptide repeat-containing protein [Alkalispirochaeta americana]
MIKLRFHRLGGAQPLRRKIPEVFLFVVAAVALGGAVLLLSGCPEKKEPELDFLRATEGVEYQGVEVAPERIAELRREARRYRSKVEEVTEALAREASFQKLLANELMQQGMHGPALEALQRALAIQTDNPVLYYLAAVASGRAARAHRIDGGREKLLEQAEALYRDAIALNPRYRAALFGLSVLLSFELDRPQEALEYARRTAELETKDPAVRFLLAHVLVRTGELAEASRIYDDLARTAPAAEQRRRAAANRDELRRNWQ